MQLDESRRARLLGSVEGQGGKGSKDETGLSGAGVRREAAAYTVTCAAVTVARTKPPVWLPAEAGGVATAAVKGTLQGHARPAGAQGLSDPEN